MEEELKGVERWIVEGRGGGGGKGGGARVPTEDPDTLRSRAEAKVLAAFCEGEIEGFPPGNSNRYIYLDGTPLVNANGTTNFDNGVIVSYTRGTQDQASLPGFDDIRIEQTVGVKVSKNIGPVSRTTSRGGLSRIYVRVGVAALFRAEDDGDVKGTDVSFKIQIADVGGNFIVNEDRSIGGKTRGPFDIEYSYSTGASTGPWTITVTRLTDDPTNVKINNDFYFKAFVGVIEQTLRYPNTVVMGLSVSAENFQSIPEVSARLRGMKIKVPTNYNAGSGTYSGVWNGQFRTEYSNNPVWVFYDLLTNPRYGCGAQVDPISGEQIGVGGITASDVDVYSLLPIAKYCDELVPDGRGGVEKRYEFNAYINNRGEAYEVLNSLAAAFRGMIYYAQGLVIATQDRPTNAIRQFSPANVVVEVDDSGNVTKPPFVYEGTALKARKTVALVSWNDRNDQFKSKIEYVEDRAAIDRYGYRETEVRALGCTSQGQAQRIGRWILLSNLNETETVTFRVSAEGFFLMPGEVIEIADPYKSIGIYAGTIVSAGSNAVVIDRDVALEVGKSYQIIIRTGDGNEFVATVTNSPGATDTITFSPGFTEIPEVPAAWIIRELNAEPRKYRVVGLNEDSGIVTVLATSYYAEKYDLVDSQTSLSAQTTSVAGITVTPTVTAGNIVIRNT
jgi:predicted phage tail protein